jgi:hypothetical protein
MFNPDNSLKINGYQRKSAANFLCFWLWLCQAQISGEFTAWPQTGPLPACLLLNAVPGKAYT